MPILPALTGLAAMMFLSGCTLSPSLNVLGAFFPGWLFCIFGGLMAALVARSALIRAGIAECMGPLALLLLYPLLTALFSLLAWLLFFIN